MDNVNRLAIVPESAADLVTAVHGAVLDKRDTAVGEHIDAAGKVDTLMVTTSGSGKFTGANLACGTGTATTSSSGNITVWAKDTRNTHTSGSGNVEFYGSPTFRAAKAAAGG